MTKRTQETEPKSIEFSRQGRRMVEGRFDGGSMSSDAGVMLLSEIDRKIGLTQAAAPTLPIHATPCSSPTPCATCCANASMAWHWAGKT